MTRRLHRRQQDPPVGHSHRLPSWLIGSILIIGLGLLAGLVIVAQQSIATNNRLTDLEQYVAGKGEQRDAENARQNDRIDQAVCNVLDQLPTGGRLDAVRTDYGCGPGQPPAAAIGPSSTATASASASTAAPRPTASGGSAAPGGPTADAAPTPTADPSISAAVTSPLAPPPTAAPSSSPALAPPDRGPVIDLLCSLQLLC